MTFFGTLPLTMNPPIPTPSPPLTVTRVEMFANLTSDADGAGVADGEAVGLADADAVRGERFTVTAGALAVAVCAALSVTVTFAVKVPALA